MRIAMTGATGLLGSNFLLEWIKNYLGRLNELEILVLGRQKKEQGLESRIHKLVAGEEGRAYLQAPARVKEIELFLKERVKYINYDLGLPGLGISSEGQKTLRQAPIDFFFHIASITDFRNTAGVDKTLERVIVGGTRDLLSVVDTCDVKEFVYVGTAYSCGYKGGVLAPDVIDFNVKFRNSYERRKLETEVMVREHCRKKGLRLRVFRPSTICGRLIEEPIGAVTKFDVFYAWVAWFLRLKIKSGIPSGKLYETPLEVNLRTACRADSGLNIVPADYAAKVMYQVCIQNRPGNSYYLVHATEIPHYIYMKWMLDYIKIAGVSYVDNIPKDLNEIEKLYYKTVGGVFTGYISSAPMLFDVGNISFFEHRLSIDKNKFETLLSYARRRAFGLSK